MCLQNARLDILSPKKKVSCQAQSCKQPTITANRLTFYISLTVLPILMTMWKHSVIRETHWGWRCQPARVVRRGSWGGRMWLGCEVASFFPGPTLSGYMAEQVTVSPAHLCSTLDEKNNRVLLPCVQSRWLEWFKCIPRPAVFDSCLYLCYLFLFVCLRNEKKWKEREAYIQIDIPEQVHIERSSRVGLRVEVYLCTQDNRAEVKD